MRYTKQRFALYVTQKNIMQVKPNSTIKNHTGSWRIFKPIVDYNKCVGCGTCAKICPEGCIRIKKIKNKLQANINYDYCKGCGLCAVECPVEAIIIKKSKI